MNMPIRLTPAVKTLLITYIVVYLIQQTVDQFFGGNFIGTFGLVPAAFFSSFKIWQLFTYSFLHADVFYLLFNLMMLVFFGADLEATWGTARFLRFYFFCATAGGLVYLLLQVIVRGSGMYSPMIGTSAGIYGLLVAYGLIYGERVMLFMMLFPMKAKHFVWILAGAEFFSTIFSGRGGLSGIAHLGGMGAGFAYLWIRATWVVMQKQRSHSKMSSQRTKRVKSSKHLKLVKGRGDFGDDPDGGSGGKDSHRDPRTWH
jgi:membrane associated rhomboid family serine protease